MSRCAGWFATELDIGAARTAVYFGALSITPKLIESLEPLVELRTIGLTLSAVVEVNG